jgi:hypothetical protein
MRQNLMLTITSLLSIVLMTLHLSSDTLRARSGSSEAGGSTLRAIPVLAVWLYGTVVLADRRSGRIIMAVGSLLAVGMPVIHSMGSGDIVRGDKSGLAYLFVWTLHAIGVTGMFSLLLSARDFWRRRHPRPQ